ncbi:uncharacterized protein BDV17DRAFT_295000 [Aspergillus undulatus]|uniref:uncharacterized protein n=1 Tax=Aspergillus undulatus TaxID=1810928 RepID=UPI003CCD85E4
MTQLPTPPASRQSSVLPDAELKQLHIADPPPHLLQSLDDLLERYLQLLDKHQRLQKELASSLSSGFFSLAHANYTCPPGRRYGADYYDERMKASRRVTLKPPSSPGNAEHDTEVEEPPQSDTPYGPIFAIEPATASAKEEQADVGGQSEPSDSDAKTSEPELSKSDEDYDPVPSAAPNSSEAKSEADTKPESAKQKPRTSDPIRWYGILVPPSLRSAQKSFTEAVEGSLPELASTVVAMQVAEKEILRLRTELGRQ